MKKNYFVAFLALLVNLATAQIEPTTYRGAFAPSIAQWTDGWTNFDPQNANYSPQTAPGSGIPKPVVLVSADITANTTWNANNVYELNGTIFVRNNATLTIPPGTLIRSNVTASALIVTRGAKLNALGTVTNPIVFTSKNAAGSRNRGDWGGIVLLGRGRYNINNGANFIEGISQTVETQFGGGLSPINNDNSGILRYVRIEYAGYVFSPNNELNGLTMGAVGSGTTIDYVQVSYSNDDSFEWFGGSVDCKHLVAFAGLDDDFDTDNGYNGRVQFGLSIKDPLGFDISTSECFESDNSAGTGAPVGNATTDAWKTSAIFTNFTCLGPVYRATLTTPATTVNSLHDKAARLRRASELKVFNSLFLDFRRGLLFENASVANFTTNNTTKWQNNIIAGSTPIISTTTDITNKYNAGSNSSLAGTTTITAATGTSLILVNPYPANSGTTTAPGYTDLDYRPGTESPALSGASFADPTFEGILSQVETPNPIVTTPINYCKGATAAPLVVVSSPGTTLRWYTAATGGTPSTATPAVLTTAVGTKTYYVTQFNATTGVESTPRTAIVVNTIATPTVALGTITNFDGTTAITAIGQYVGTTTPITYRVPLSTEVGVTGYVWTLPLGVNSVSQTTDATHAYQTVNFNNVPAGAETYGSIGVQTENAAGCRGTIKTTSLSKALPAGPTTLKMFDPTISSTVARTSFGEYMGTTKQLNLVAASVSTASFYVWELPTGVNPVLGTAGQPTVKLYSSYPFINTISSAPAAVGNVFYSVTETVYSSGIVIQTATRSVVGGTLTNGVVVAPVTNAPVTNLTNEGATINPAFPILSSPTGTISVDFAGVTGANTFNYTTTAGVSTNVLRIGVKSRNGVGVSTTSNAALTNPTTTSTARQLTLTATGPKAPTLKLTNDAVSTSTAVTAVSKFIGTPTNLTLACAVVAGASSYEWSLPVGINVIGGNPLTDRVLVVNFAGVTSGITTLYIGARAKNGLGSSNSSSANTAVPSPYTNSPFALLKLTAAVPAAVSSVTGQITGLCPSQTVAYSFPASPLANTYTITAPAGSVVTSTNNPSNATNVLSSSSDLNFTVTYPSIFVINAATLVANKTISIRSENGVGNSTTNRVLTLTTGQCPSIPKLDSEISGTKSSITMYPNPASDIFNVELTVGANEDITMSIVAINGAVVSSRKLNVTEGFNTINENVSSLKTGIYFVQFVNATTNETIVKKLVKN